MDQSKVVWISYDSLKEALYCSSWFQSHSFPFLKG